MLSFLLKCDFFETRSLSMPAVTFVFISSSHFQALKSAQAFIIYDFGDPQSGKEVCDRQIATDRPDSEEPCAL